MSGLVQCSIIYEHIDVIVTVLQYFLGFDKIFTKNASTTKLLQYFTNFLFLMVPCTSIDFQYGLPVSLGLFS